MGGFGGFSASGSQEFLDLITARGQTGELNNLATDIGIWGGSISFDTDANWHNTTDLVGLDFNEFDFFSVAIHELSHVLGFGISDSWNAQVNNSNFTGVNALDVYQSETAPSATSIPLESGGVGHWSNGTTSLTLEGNLQETALDPDITNGQRKLLTNLACRREAPRSTK